HSLQNASSWWSGRPIGPRSAGPPFPGRAMRGHEPVPTRGTQWREAMTTRRSCYALAVAGSLLLLSPAKGEQVLRIAMTASDIPTTTGMPNNGFEGLRFLVYPIFEGLVSWDLARADVLAGLRPGLAERWEQAADDKKTWV